jgi:ABC-type lipoprotein release transport system permease subunit
MIHLIMQPLIIGAVAVIAGVLLGYWLRGMLGQPENAQLER